MSDPDIISRPSPNHDARAHAISMAVLHYTGMRTGEEALERMCSPEAAVSAHYMIEEDGRIFQLVSEEDRAWHAGRSRWRGMADINSRSIGIELVNPGHEWGYRLFPEKQMKSAIRLLHEIMRLYEIAPRDVVGHSDIAPSRKSDPGELFDWQRLARLGLAVQRPTRALTDPGWSDAAFLLALERYGYDVSDGRAATIAFQRRFRPEILDGVIDGQCRAILMRLLLDLED